MPADGVSLPTTLAQMGNVAKAQAKGQQVAPQVTPFSGQKENEEELRVQRVKETTPADKNRVSEEAEEKDKRKRRRLKRNSVKGKQGMPSDGKDSETGKETDADEEQRKTDSEPLGTLIDLRV